MVDMSLKRLSDIEGNAAIAEDECNKMGI